MECVLSNVYGPREWFLTTPEVSRIPQCRDGDGAFARYCGEPVWFRLSRVRLSIQIDSAGGDLQKRKAHILKN